MSTPTGEAPKSAPARSAHTAGTGRTPHIGVAIIGAGFSGLGAAIRLTRENNSDFLVFEREEGLGGTWLSNNYPGAACDVMSLLYSYSFAPYSGWKTTFGSREEILEYLRATARRFGIEPYLRFGHALEGAAWEEDAQRWRIRTSRGEWTSDVLLLGTGYLSDPTIPDIPGLETFGGRVVHTAHWDPEIRVEGARVGVVGSGASAAQLVPSIQPRVGELTVFQRTPAWVAPTPNRVIGRRERWMRRNLPGYQRFRREFNRRGREIVVTLMNRPGLMTRTIQARAQAQLESQVPAGALREALTPSYIAGCKRVLFSNTFYPALTSPNVSLVPHAVTRIEGNTVVAGEHTREVDILVFATGYQAADRPIAKLIRNGSGQTLAERWGSAPTAHHGTTVSGFPNLFLMLGPNTALGHSSQILMIEAQLRYILSALTLMRERGISSVDVLPAVQERASARLQRSFDGTVWDSSHCSSWYAPEAGHNPTVWPATTARFERETRRFRASEYRLTSLAARSGSPRTERTPR